MEWEAGLYIAIRRPGALTDYLRSADEAQLLIAQGDLDRDVTVEVSRSSGRVAMRAGDVPELQPIFDRHLGSLHPPDLEAANEPATDTAEQAVRPQPETTPVEPPKSPGREPVPETEAAGTPLPERPARRQPAPLPPAPSRPAPSRPAPSRPAPWQPPSDVPHGGDEVGDAPHRTPDLQHLEARTPTRGRALRWILGIGFALYLITILALLADDGPRQASEPPTSAFYARTDANIRDAPTVRGTRVLGTLRRGDRVDGEMVTNTQTQVPWIRIGSGPYAGAYVWGELMSDRPRPDLRLVNQRYRVDVDRPVMREPFAGAQAIGRVQRGERVTVIGTTDDLWAEIRFQDQVGYVFIGD
ncbi:MAG: hypothetical protein SNJ79_12825 [Sphingomonadaceae bacterium]